MIVGEFGAELVCVGCFCGCGVVTLEEGGGCGVWVEICVWLI